MKQSKALSQGEYTHDVSSLEHLLQNVIKETGQICLETVQPLVLAVLVRAGQFRAAVSVVVVIVVVVVVVVVVVLTIRYRGKTDREGDPRQALHDVRYAGSKVWSGGERESTDLWARSELRKFAWFPEKSRTGMLPVLRTGPPLCLIWPGLGCSVP